MVLQILVLLLLCPSLGTCATLGFYPTKAGEEEPKAENLIMDTSSLGTPEQETVVEKPLAKEHAAKSETAESQAAEDIIAETLDANEVAFKIPAVDNLKEAEAQDPKTDTDTMTGHLPSVEAPSVEPVTGEAVILDEEMNNIRAVETSTSVDESIWSLNSIRGSVEAMNGYFDSLVELVGGRDGVCQYRCKYGVPPQPRPGYQVAQPNGCSSSLVGLQFDLGIPAMTECCSQLDLCYEKCGESKKHCDSIFRWCLHSICSDLKKTLGFVSQVHACESMADALHSTVGTLGCRPYMNSQRAACICEGEERDEL